MFSLETLTAWVDANKPLYTVDNVHRLCQETRLYYVLEQSAHCSVCHEVTALGLTI